MMMPTPSSESPPHPPSQQQIEQQTEQQKAKSPPKPTHRKCENCKQLLPQQLFSKNDFKKPSSISICCHQCRKNKTAKRLNQKPKALKKVGRIADSGTVRRPNNFGYCNYVDKLFSMRCCLDIISLQAFLSAKDISESMAAIQAATKHGMIGKNKDNTKKIKCLCIGDGSTPRTAVLACFWKQWTCVSIDPALHDDWHGETPKDVRGLTGFGGTLEEFLSTPAESDINDNDYYHLVLLCVHSHARLIENASIDCIMARYNNIPTTLVSLPCCPKFRSHRDVGRRPDIQYDDDCVFSACRKVEIWNFASGYTESITKAISTMICGEVTNAN
jgi:hypothetical protein